jgi:hypothetical protein
MPLEQDSLTGLPGHDAADFEFSFSNSPVRTRFEAEPYSSQGRGHFLDYYFEGSRRLKGETNTEADVCGWGIHFSQRSLIGSIKPAGV